MIRKAIIPIAGLGTRLLPLSKVVPKELWPLVDKPVIQYIVEEARASGIEEIIFVVSPEKKFVLDYFKKSKRLEKILKEKKMWAFVVSLGIGFIIIVLLGWVFDVDGTGIWNMFMESINSLGILNEVE